MLCSFEAMAVQIAKVKIEIFKQKMTKIYNYELQMSYVPQQKAEKM